LLVGWLACWPSFYVKDGQLANQQKLVGDSSFLRIINKQYHPFPASVFENPISPNCIDNCFQGESAYIELEAPTFSFRINLVLATKPYQDNINPRNHVYTSYQFDYIPNRILQRKILEIKLEDHLNIPVSPNNAGGTYYENYSLYGRPYHGIFTNEGYDDFGFTAREEIYFHPEDGLVAVQDSLGELWIRD